ncbi:MULTISPECIES: hypothetical protein [unclassified Bacillus (in: firmicutes)]|uniref:hypothetical protein n=1 Tax=unclassified Bacillus (in: firmicutes) TaxID=185979 RepID=UPI00040E821B|nr:MULTISPECIES: hypothetical protein [unclassified Bacillus (in: firmicutes)]QHZ47256.1 hypothetical protein M654_013645 [Bacillus sp. NSP9.1]WFA03317.1 hypothetical protein P3X63_11455 [Bacillus sp. HSf4]
MILPAVDLGLMAEHLSTHKGMLHKLKGYYSRATNAELKEIIGLQINVMRMHVKVMLQLINPYNQNSPEVTPLHALSDDPFRKKTGEPATAHDHAIALEARASAKNMAGDNFFSALLMKDNHVRNAHIQMALQQASLQEMYSRLIKRMGLGYTPHASINAQIGTYQHFEQLF